MFVGGICGRMTNLKTNLWSWKSCWRKGCWRVVKYKGEIGIGGINIEIIISRGDQIRINFMIRVNRVGYPLSSDVFFFFFYHGFLSWPAADCGAANLSRAVKLWAQVSDACTKSVVGGNVLAEISGPVRGTQRPPSSASLFPFRKHGTHSVT